MSNTMEEISILLKSRTQCIWVQTFEEQLFVDKMSKLVSESFPQTKLQVYSLTQGMARVPMGAPSDANLKYNKEFAQPSKLMAAIDEFQNKPKEDNERNIFILRDYNDMFSKAEVIRCLRDIKSKSRYNSYNPIIIVSPVVDIPLSLQKMFQVVTMGTPEKDEIKSIVCGVVSSMQKNQKKMGVEIPNDDQINEIVNALCGITNNEIINILMRSIQKYKTIKIDAIIEEKINAIKKSGTLSYKVPKVGMTDVGGNQMFKNWFEEVKACFSPQARELGIPLQKGYLALGLPGTC